MLFKENRQNRAATLPGVAWVTGAAGGLGSATVLALRDRGWTVAGVDCRTGLSPDGAAMMASVDVADPVAMREAAQEVETRLGPISLVVCNAGIYRRTSIQSFDAETHARVLAVNYNGVANTIAAVLPGMLDRDRGRIVIVSSLAGYRGARPDISGYGASKAALINLADGFEYMLRGCAVDVRLVSPGYIDTPLMRAAGGSKRLAISPERAAVKVAAAATSDRFEIRFPLSQAAIVSVLGALPRALHRLARKRPRT